MKTFLLMMLGLMLTGVVVWAGPWELVWSDEFSYQGLPDQTKWSYEEGFVRNHESQYYTRARQENARVERGQWPWRMLPKIHPFAG